MKIIELSYTWHGKINQSITQILIIRKIVMGFTHLWRKIENIKANSATIVNVRVVNRRSKRHTRRLKRIPIHNIHISK